jgi:tetratricopeptide (TPR) repeat protein
MGIVEAQESRFDEVRRYIEITIPLSEGLAGGYKAVARTNLGGTLLGEGDYAGAGRWVGEALVIARGIDNGWMICGALLTLASLALLQEDYPAARPYLEEALRVGEEIDYLPVKANGLAYLGIAWYSQGEFDKSRRSLQASLGLGFKGGVKFESWAALTGVMGLLSQVWLKEGQAGLPEQVVQLAGAIDGILRARGKYLWQPNRKFYDRALGTVRPGLTEAAFAEAFARGQALTLEEAVALARQALAAL